MQSKIKNKKPKIELLEDPLPPTPASLGYSMPAEWEPHDATWIVWPHNTEDFPDKLDQIPFVYAEIVRILAQGERVHIFVQPSRHGHFAREVKNILRKCDANLAHITLHTVPTDRVWTRDSGPIFLRKAQRHKGTKAQREGTLFDAPAPLSASVPQSLSASPLAIADFKFNAWAKYDNSALDDQLPAIIADHLDLPRFIVFGQNNKGELQRFVLEGGSIDVNGGGVEQGCVLTTEECLLSRIQQRNPGFSREKIEQTLCDYLGVSKVLWLNKGIKGDDDTHGHVDDITRFVSPNTIITCIEPDTSDYNHAVLKENLERLKKFRDPSGRQFNIIELPLPAPVYFDDKRLPASYANFYLANAGVLVPVFNDPHDVTACKILEQAIPDRPIIPIYARDLVWGLGAVHCITQQQPAG